MSQNFVRAVLRNVKTIKASRFIGICLGILLVLVDVSLAKPNPADSANSFQTVSLPQVLNKALSKNSKLSALRSEANGARASVNADEPILPPPTVTGGSMGNSGPFQKRIETSVTFSQTIPFPTKSFSRRNAISYEGDAREATARSYERQLQSDVVRVYYEYLASSKQLELLMELKEIYHHHLKRLRAGAAQDQLMKSHILSAQSELNALDNELENVRASQEATRGELNVLMGETPTVPLGTPEEPPLSSVPDALNDDSLNAVLTRHPDYQEIDARLKQAESLRSAARSSWLPDFMISYRYNKRLNAMPDEQEVMVGVSVPFVTFWQLRAENERATAQLEAAQSEKIQQDRELLLRYMKIRAQLLALRAQLENLEKRIVPEAHQRVKIVTSLSPTDMSSLIEHREALEKYVKFKMELITKRTEYESAIAVLQNLTRETADLGGPK